MAFPGRGHVSATRQRSESSGSALTKFFTDICSGHLQVAPLALKSRGRGDGLVFSLKFYFASKSTSLIGNPVRFQNLEPPLLFLLIRL